MATTTTHTSFWQRVGTMFRGNGAGRGNGHAHERRETPPAADAAAVGHDLADAALLAGATDDEACRNAPDEPAVPNGRDAGGTHPDRSAESNADAPSSGGFALSWRRRRPSDAAMRERYERVGRLLDSLREHFEHQDRRAEQIGLSVGRMADVLEKLPELQSSQGECMQAIAAHLGTANRHASELRDTLTRVPTSIQAQAEAISALSRQMASGNKSDMQMVGALQRLARVVNGLGIASRNQVETLTRMRTEFDQQRESLATVIREQNRRYLVTAAIAGVVTVGAIAALILSLAS